MTILSCAVYSVVIQLLTMHGYCRLTAREILVDSHGTSNHLVAVRRKVDTVSFASLRVQNECTNSTWVSEARLALSSFIHL